MNMLIRMRLLLLILLACVSLPASGFMGTNFCGGTAVQGDPTDMDNQLGDMSLQAAVSQPANIISCSKGYLLAKCGDHENANKIFDKCIDAGYVGAMIWKALQFENGNGTEQNSQQAAELLRRAASSNDPAYAPIGKMHYATVLYQGRGVPQDKQAAMDLFREAAAEGNEEAAEFLRTGYHVGARDQRAMGAGTPTAAALAPLLQDAEVAVAAAHTLEAAAQKQPAGLQLKPVVTAALPPQTGPAIGYSLLLLAVFALGYLLQRPRETLAIRLPALIP